MSPSNPMRLVNVYREPTAARVLYALLSDRPQESRISHRTMPDYAAHEAFVRSRPYRLWWLIRVDGGFVGDIHVTHLNEIGVFIFSAFRGNGYGAQAVKLFMARHRPLPAIKAKRIGSWLANIAPENDDGASFFKKLGFKKVQETWRLHQNVSSLS